MRTYTATGIICSNTKLGEADKILHVYCDVGFVRAVAKGARKTKSKYGGRTEPLSHVNLLLYKGKNLDTITQIELVRPFNKLRTDLKLMSVAMIMTSFIEKTSEHESHPGELLEILIEGLEKLESGFLPELVLINFMGKALSLLGYIFHLDCCVRCGSRLGERLLFGVDSGGFLCARCSGLDEWTIGLDKTEALFLSNLIISGQTVDTLQNTSVEQIKKVSKIFEAFIRYHLDINLKGYRFLKQI